MNWTALFSTTVHVLILLNGASVVLIPSHQTTLHSAAHYFMYYTLMYSCVLIYFHTIILLIWILVLGRSTVLPLSVLQGKARLQKCTYIICIVVYCIKPICAIVILAMCKINSSIFRDCTAWYSAMLFLAKTSSKLHLYVTYKTFHLQSKHKSIKIIEPSYWTAPLLAVKWSQGSPSWRYNIKTCVATWRSSISTSKS